MECKIDLEQNYTEEEEGEDVINLVSEVRNSNNYYQVLGLGWAGIWSSTEKINNAYTDLSVKLDPEKNKAPGSEEALKKVNDAFKCLSHRPSRILHPFIVNAGPGKPSLLFWIGLLILGVVFFTSLCALATTYPPLYQLKILNDYRVPMTAMSTKEHGIVFYVTSTDEFEAKYPVGTAARVHIEREILDEYQRLLQAYCSDELGWHLVRPDFPTPICNKLQNMGVYA